MCGSLPPPMFSDVDIFADAIGMVRGARVPLIKGIKAIRITQET